MWDLGRDTGLVPAVALVGVSVSALVRSRRNVTDDAANAS